MDTLSYRADIQPGFIEKKREYSADENDYRTLKNVQKKLDNAIYDLEHSFNAFDVLSEEDPEIVARKLMIDIEARQLAFRYLIDLKAAIDGAINKVDSKNSKE